MVSCYKDTAAIFGAVLYVVPLSSLLFSTSDASEEEEDKAPETWQKVSENGPFSCFYTTS